MGPILSGYGAVGVFLNYRKHTLYSVSGKSYRRFSPQQRSAGLWRSVGRGAKRKGYVRQVYRRRWQHLLLCAVPQCRLGRL
jgi:hypothetical protein